MADAGKKGSPKPDLRSRAPRKKSGGILGKLVFVAILAALCGVGYVYRTQIMTFVNNLQKKEEPKVVRKDPEPAPAKKEEPKDAAVAPVIPAKPQQEEKKAAAVVIPPKAAIPTGEEDIAKKLIAEGRSALETFDFKKAGSLFKQASEKKAGEFKSEAETWVKKALQFEHATNHIPVADYAAAETTYILTTTDDRLLSGLKLSEDAQTIRFQSIPPHNPASTGKTILPVGKPDVKSITEVSKQQRRNEFLQLLGQLESGVIVSRSTDYYDLVFISKRLGLGKECVEYLNRAYNGGPDHAPDPFLGDSFRKEVVRRAIDQCSMMLAAGRAKRFVQDELNKLQKTLPTYQLAQDEIEAFKVSVLSKFRDDFKSTLKEVKKAPPVVAAASEPSKPAPKISAKELVTEDQITEVVIDDSGVKGKGAAGPVVDQANQLYDEGIKLYRGYKQGSNTGNNQALEGAMKKLQAAVDLYDKALQMDGSNKAILDRQTEASMIVYACKKYKTL